ncbi:MAG TPA: hypothetical protein VGO79_12655, partial [Thermoanaerobaculia bacterium]
MPRRVLVAAFALLLSCSVFAGRKLSAAGGYQGVTIDALVLDPSNPQTLYAAKSSGLFQSRDGGASWSLVSAFPAGLLAIAPSSPSVLYAAGGPA